MTDPPPIEPRPPILVYLDHSILNQMEKGREELRKALSANNLQVVYSDANLAEIVNSRGHEHEFFSVLEALGAKYLRVVLDDGFRVTDRAVIDSVPPAKAFASYLENQQESPAGDFGLGGFVHKLYGGSPNRSFGDIALTGQEEYSELMDKMAQDLATAELRPEFGKEAFPIAPPEMKRTFAAVSRELAQMFDADAQRNNVRAIRGELGAGPEELNKLVGPYILKQVWACIAAKIPEGKITLDEFFGLVPAWWDTDKRQRTKLEQINAAYHQLNFCGYWPDTEMKKGQKFQGHLRDLTHVAMASFCNVFLSGDERQVKKAKAVYEHLGIGTCVHHIPPPERKQGPS